MTPESSLVELEIELTGLCGSLARARASGAPERELDRLEGLIADARRQRTQLGRHLGVRLRASPVHRAIERVRIPRFYTPPEVTGELLVVESCLARAPRGHQFDAPQPWLLLDEVFLSSAGAGDTISYRLAMFEDIGKEAPVWTWLTTAWMAPSGRLMPTLDQLGLHLRRTEEFSRSALRRVRGPVPPELWLLLINASALLRILGS
jgi:hypothetical protein